MDKKISKPVAMQLITEEMQKYIVFSDIWCALKTARDIIETYEED